MIYNIQTFCTYGYWPEDLSSQSGKPIIIACDKCGKIRISRKYAYRDLCASCARKEYLKNHPDAREKISKAQLKRYEDPKEHEKQSKEMLKLHEDNPIISQRKSESQLKRYENTEEHNKTSIAGLKRYEDPKERKKNSDGQLEFYGGLDDPGQQILMHHYIYDFNDWNKYRIPVTRSEHTTIHNNLRYAELEVPCINILKED